MAKFATDVKATFTDIRRVDRTRFKERFDINEISGLFENNIIIEECFCVDENGKEKWERLSLLLADKYDANIYHVVLTIQKLVWSCYLMKDLM